MAPEVMVKLLGGIRIRRRAYHQAAILRFYSKGLREAMLASAKQREAERKAVPKF